MPGNPDPRLARERYDRMAASYDRQLAPLRSRQEAIRRQAVARLRLEPGQGVLDVGCGTGASFELLVEAVGPQGWVVGIDHSPGMLAVARRRPAAGLVQRHPHPQCRSGHDGPAAGRRDTAVFIHDLLRTPQALEGIITAVRPGGRIVAAGVKRPSWWLASLYPVVWLAVRRYVTTLDGAGRPWSLLAQRLEHLTIEQRFGGPI